MSTGLIISADPSQGFYQFFSGKILAFKRKAAVFYPFSRPIDLDFLRQLLEAEASLRMNQKGEIHCIQESQFDFYALLKYSFVILFRVKDEGGWINRMRHSHPDIPIMVLSRFSHLNKGLAAMRLGVKDYFPAVVQRDEFAKGLSRFFGSPQKGAQKKVVDFLNEAYVDEVTGLYNTRFLYRVLEEHVSIFLQSSLALLFLDIDYFKSVNDRYGHLLGSRVLREFSLFLKQIVPRSSFICRYGGDEFVILLPQTQREEAQRIAEKIRQEVAGASFLKSPLESSQGLLQLTVSIGVSVFPEDAPSILKALEEADQAMYSAKKKDRNCVVFSNEHRPPFL